MKDRYRIFALRCFRENRKEAERSLVGIRHDIASHRHSWLCCFWCPRKRWQKEAAIFENHIAVYAECEKALEAGNFLPVIEILDQIASWFKETPIKIARRVAREAVTPENIMSSPTALRARILQLKQGLEAYRASGG